MVVATCVVGQANRLDAYMTTWIITPGVTHPAAEDGALFHAVEDDEEPGHPRHHDTRHMVTMTGALGLLIGPKMRRGDTLKVAGAEAGRQLRVDLVQHGQQFSFDVGTHEIWTPEELVRWLDGMLQPGDTLEYLPY